MSEIRTYHIKEWIDLSSVDLQMRVISTKDFKAFMNGLINELKSWQNPYPPDVFSWDNLADRKEISTGRFNQFVWQVVENTRTDLIKVITDNMEEQK